MATRTWLGNAAAIKQVDTITIANTWAASDTCTLTINSKDLVITIGSLVTTAQVATTIQQAIENETSTDTTATRSPGNGKLDFPELAEFVATVSGSVVTLTANTAGNPITLSVVAVTAGSGTAVEATATAATGPNHFNNTDNWSGATVPVNGDVIIFDQSGKSDCLYSIATGFAAATVYVNKGYTGNIGLAAINRADARNPYAEYRTRLLEFTAAITLNVGHGTGEMGSRVFVKSANVTLDVLDSGRSEIRDEPVVQVMGTGYVDGSIRGGFVGIGFREEDTSIVGSVVVDPMPGNDARLVLGGGCTFTSSAPTFTQRGGSVLMVQSVGASNDFNYTIEGGEANILGGLINNTTVGGGRFRWNTKTNQAGSGVNVLRGNGVVDFTNSSASSLTVNTFERYSNDAFVRDPNKVVASLIFDNNHCGNMSGNDFGTNYKITRAAVS